MLVEEGQAELGRYWNPHILCKLNCTLLVKALLPSAGVVVPARLECGLMFGSVFSGPLLPHPLSSQYSV